MPSSRHRSRPAARLLRAAVATGLLLAAGPAAAQTGGWVAPPSADWRTLESQHFRVHYPVQSEAWARRAAARLEAVREAVAAEVGFAPREVVDVVVSDPAAAPNGFALPILGWPRMVLWTSPPGADSVIGHYRDWSELLLVHEDTHIVHLLRPSRNPLRRALASFLPLSPMAQAPRWVSEGYATVVEGRLTGSGRPHSDLRAAILRRWALAGQLPSYGRLAADESSYLGMSMAYLAGSAYLEWLEGEAAAAGREDSLRDLWARLTARRARSFEAAFEGVYGDSPRDLWDRFRAETTFRALTLEKALEKALDEELGRRGGESGAADDGSGPWHEGDLWLDLAWATGAPAVSPDGARFALVLGHRDEPSELAVFATEVDAEALAEREAEVRRIAEADPDDVPAVDLGPPPRRRLHTLPTLDGAAPSQPRWLATEAGGPGALLLVRHLPDARGLLHPDLFRWTPETGELARLTRGADLRDPDPAPAAAEGAGTWAVAVRNRHGFSQLVRVDLADGTVEALTEPSLAEVHDSPRLSPDGRRLVYARHAGGAWSLRVRDLAGGDEVALPVPAGVTVASPAWGTTEDGEAVFASLGRDGFIDVYAFVETGDGDGDSGAWTARRLTRSRGAALAPEPAPAVGEEPAGVFFLSLEPDGLDLRRVALGDLAAADGEVKRAAETGMAELGSSSLDLGDLDDLDRAELWPVVPPPGLEPLPAPPAELSAAELGAGRPYGLGPRQEWLPLSSGAAGAAGSSLELGARAGDLLGRLDTVAVGAWGEDGGARGGSLATTWRRLPVELSLHLAAVGERPSRQQDLSLFAAPAAAPEALARALDLDRLGVEVSAGRSIRRGAGALAWRGGAWWGRLERDGVDTSRTGPGGPGTPVVAPLDDDEASLFAATLWSPRGSSGELGYGLDLGGRWDVGDSGDAGSWQRWRGRARVAGRWGDWSLAADWQRGEASGEALEPRAVPRAGTVPLPGEAPAGQRAAVPAPWQLFRVGGLPSSLRPSSLDAPRVGVPALPEAALVGSEMEAQRLDLATPLAPLPFFWARYRVAGAGLGDGRGAATALGDADWTSLAGVEWRGRLGPLPMLRLPELGYTLGGAEILDGPAQGERQWWVALSVRP